MSRWDAIRSAIEKNYNISNIISYVKRFSESDVVDEFPDRESHSRQANVEINVNIKSALQFIVEDFKEIVNDISLIVSPSSNESMNRYHGGLSLPLRTEVMRQDTSAFSANVFKVSYFLQILIF
jgi:hypothetical protein